MKHHSKKWLSILLAAMITSTSASAVSAVWDQDQAGNWSWKENNQAVTGWKQVDQSWYYFSKDGTMYTGWLKDQDNHWYYLNENGDMAIGWKFVDGAWYYLDGNGAMATGWRFVDSAWYYLDESGAMATGWRFVNGSWFYLDENGAMAAGWRFVDGAWYYLDESGAMATGWKLVDGVWYYLNAGGNMQTGWLWSNAWYYLNASGQMVSGWVFADGQYYFTDASGVMQTGLIQVDTSVYYFAENGAMATGDVVIHGQTYHFGQDGRGVGSFLPSPDKVFQSNGMEVSSGGWYPGNGGGGSSTPETPDEETGVDETVRASDDAAMISFRAPEKGYVYLLLSPMTKASLTAEEIINHPDSVRYAVKDGSNTISVDNLTEGVSYSAYLAFTDAQQQNSAVLDSVEIQAEVDTTIDYQDISIQEVRMLEAGKVQVTLSAKPKNALTLEDFNIFCPAGKDMTIVSVNTTDQLVYELSTAYYNDNTYCLEIRLSEDQVIQGEFEVFLDCPQITGEEITRTAEDAALFVFGSDAVGTIYCLPVEKTSARAAETAPTAEEVKKSGQSFVLDTLLNTAEISGLKADTAYSLYYVTVDREGKNTSPVLGPVDISAEVKTSAAKITSSAAVSSNEIQVVFDQAVAGLTVDHFAVSCPKGALKLSRAVTNDGGKTYSVYLKEGSNFLEKVNYTIAVTFSDNSIATGHFYTDLYGPMLTSQKLVRYSETEVSYTFESDRDGYLYYLPSTVAVNDYENKPVKATVLADGKKVAVKKGINTLDLTEIGLETKSLFYVTENMTGFQINFVDGVSVPTDISQKPGEGGEETQGNYAIVSVAGTVKELGAPMGTCHVLEVQLSSKDPDLGYPIPSNQDITITGPGTSLNGYKYLSVSTDSEKPEMVFVNILNRILDVGEYTIEIDVDGETVAKSFIVQEDFTIIS